ncbi:MAG: hypothetical protein ACRDNZ_15830, partial [Streptosporangiaceae bacterium]
ELLTAMVNELPEGELTWGQEKRIVRTGGQGQGAGQQGVRDMEITHAARPHALVVLWQAERDRRSRVAAEMERLGLEKRMLQVSEAQGLALARVVRAILGQLAGNLCPACQGQMAADIPEVVPREMRRLTSA